MTNFWQRIITGTVFIGTIVSAIWFGPLSYQLLLLLISILTLQEFLKITTTNDYSPNKFAGLVLGLFTFLALTDLKIQGYIFFDKVLVFPLIAIIFFLELYRKKEHPFINIALTVTGVLYCVVPFALMNNLSVFQGFYNRGLILGYFFLLWSSDSFAYVFGNLLGKTKLFERISPKKSWEGFIGGLISTVAISFLLAYFNPEIATIHWVVIAVLIVVCGSLGDLTESLLKRSLNVKDSGSILPGHGGMLDRFDGLLLSAPFVFAYITICC